MSLKKFFKDDQGVALPIVALLFGFFLIGFVAIVVDAGTLYNTRKSMVTAADAGALAGAMEVEKSLGKSISEIETTKTQAKQIAINVAKQNGAVNPTATIEKMNIKLATGMENRDVIIVSVTKNQSLTFARILGVDDSDVSAKAVATWGFARKLSGGQFLPIFTTTTLIEKDTPLHNKFVYPDGDPVAGNWGWVEGFGNVKDIKAILSGSITEDVQISSVLEGKSGNIQAMFDGDNTIGEKNAQGLGLRFDKAFELVKYEDRKNFMRGLVPVIDDSVNPIVKENGVVELPISYFAVFQIEDYTASDNVGSARAFTADYSARVGPGGVKSYPDVKQGSIFGYFPDEPHILIDQVATVSQNDQISNGNVSETTYHKLIK